MKGYKWSTVNEYVITSCTIWAVTSIISQEICTDCVELTWTCVTFIDLLLVKKKKEIVLIDYHYLVPNIIQIQ